MSSNYAHFYTNSALDEVEVFIADYTDYMFDAHWHDTWSVGAVMSGAHDNSPKATGDGVVKSGQVTMIAPGEVHSGKVVGNDGCKYVMFYFKHSLLVEAFEQLDLKIQAFDIATFEAPELHKQLIRCASVLSDPTSDILDIEINWTHCLTLIVEQLTKSNNIHHLINSASKNKKLLIARDYLIDKIDDDIRLDELAIEANLSKFHLSRQFSRTFNMSPNRYLRQLRLQKAKQLIREGISISETAHRCGFSDQSHLTRLFKSAFGVSPKKYILQNN